MIKSARGFTLLELFFTMVIVVILAGLAVPPFTHLIKSFRSQDLYNNVFSLIQYARSKAAFSGEDVLLCPSIDTIHCNKDWENTLIIFVDNNKNRIRDHHEVIDRSISLLKNNEKIIWRAFGSNRYIRFVSDGSTEYQNGNLTICPADKNIDLMQRIIVYKSGRARKAQQKEIKLEHCH
ncbi:hypothetical protein AB835_01005 [Candidatus Endobugula sertula]|uniref:Type II secretion system protein H n=1 Tax=Candidatus Endobugula sertula TaxID=62101 RepID=A0A1D2QTK5_9GAMM|nr:hypothetical protein AB835_01005 [Candidatus Endobugula sertula]